MGCNGVTCFAVLWPEFQVGFRITMFGAMTSYC